MAEAHLGSTAWRERRQQRTPIVNVDGQRGGSTPSRPRPRTEERRRVLDGNSEYCTSAACTERRRQVSESEGAMWQGVGGREFFFFPLCSRIPPALCGRRSGRDRGESKPKIVEKSLRETQSGTFPKSKQIRMSPSLIPPGIGSNRA